VRREENILWSFALHDIAIILRLMGALPFQVIACGGAYLQPNIVDVTVTHLLFDWTKDWGRSGRLGARQSLTCHGPMCRAW
jgi:hypothetical protein